MNVDYDYSSLDFERKITSSDIDHGVYSNKFTFVDEYFRLSSPRPDLLKKIWNDRTMFCYAFLRLDGSPLRPYPYQDLILNDPYRFKYFESSNQTGKSLCLDIDAVYDFVHDHGHGFNTAIVSKSLPQATHQMRRIKSLLNSARFDWRSAKGETDNMSVISIDIKDASGKAMYTNFLIVAPSSEGLLGYDLHKLYLDEFEFWDVDTRYFYEQIAEPRTYHTKGGIQIFTNPNGQESFGAELTRAKLPDGSRKFHVYNFNFLDKPGNTEADLEVAKSGKTRAVIESTLLAQRSLSSRNFFTPDEIDGSLDENLSELDMVGDDKQPVFFLDVGSKHDQSVLVGGFVWEDDERKDVHGNPLLHYSIPIIHPYPVGYPLSRVVGGRHNDDSDGWHYEKSVKDYIDEWSAGGVNPSFGVDATGNSGIIPLFNEVGIYPTDVQFSGPQKSAMYQRFKYLMEKRLLHRPKSRAFEYQASHLEMQKTSRGYLAPKHRSEEDLDDVMDSVAGFLNIAGSPDVVEPSLVRV